MIILFAVFIIFSLMSSIFLWMMIKGAHISSEIRIPDRRVITHYPDDNGKFRCRKTQTETHLSMNKDRKEISII